MARRARSTGHDERGAALVEFAFVLPILALFLFGIIEFGLTLNDYQSVRQGAREGARQAVVNDFTGGRAACDAGGDPAAQLVCLTKARTGVPGTRVNIVVSEGVDDFGTVEVCVAKVVSSYTGLMEPFLGGRILSSSITMRAERELDLAPGTYGDAAPATTTWGSLCE